MCLSPDQSVCRRASRRAVANLTPAVDALQLARLSLLWGTRAPAARPSSSAGLRTRRCPPTPGRSSEGCWHCSRARHSLWSWQSADKKQGSRSTKYILRCYCTVMSCIVYRVQQLQITVGTKRLPSHCWNHKAYTDCISSSIVEEERILVLRFYSCERGLPDSSGGAQGPSGIAERSLGSSDAVCLYTLQWEESQEASQPAISRPENSRIWFAGNASLCPSAMMQISSIRSSRLRKAINIEHTK